MAVGLAALSLGLGLSLVAYQSDRQDSRTNETNPRSRAGTAKTEINTTRPISVSLTAAFSSR